MKLAVVGESDFDRRTVRRLLTAIRGCNVDFISLRERPTGVAAVVRNLEKSLFESYARPDLDGLVVVVDSDRTEPHHEAEHREPTARKNCRLCELRAQVDSVMPRLCFRQDHRPFRVALGLAVPSIEAWLAWASDDPLGRQVNEAAWRNGLKADQLPYEVSELKRLVLRQQARGAVDLADALIARGVDALRDAFPDGFGPLLDEVRRWPAET